MPRQPSRTKSNGGGAHRQGPSLTLTECAYRTLKSLILRGKLPEGVFLSEARILEDHGMSRTPFREACNRLHHEELLEVVPRRGYLVRKMSFREVRDFFELRVLIEGMAAELAAIRATPEQTKELEGLLALKSPPGMDRDRQFEELIQANKRFHMCLASMTGNEELIKLITRILEGSERISYLELNAGRFQDSDLPKQHGPIAAAIKRKDARRARAAVVQDITNAQMNAFGRDFWNSAGEGALRTVLATAAEIYR